MINTNDLSVCGLYGNRGNTNTADNVDLLNMNEDKLNEIILNSEKYDPMIYKLSFNKEYPLYDNSLSIHRKIYDKANMDMYEFDLKIKELNPKCEIVGIKTDCLVYNNITKQPKTSNKWGDIKRCEVPKIHECIVNNEKYIEAKDLN